MGDAFKFFGTKIEELQMPPIYLLLSGRCMPLVGLSGLSSDLPALKISLDCAKKIYKTIVENCIVDEDIFIGLLSDNLLLGLSLDSSLGNYENKNNPDKLFYEIFCYSFYKLL